MKYIVFREVAVGGDVSCPETKTTIIAHEKYKDAFADYKSTVSGEVQCILTKIVLRKGVK